MRNPCIKCEHNQAPCVGCIEQEILKYQAKIAELDEVYAKQNELYHKLMQQNTEIAELKEKLKTAPEQLEGTVKGLVEAQDELATINDLGNKLTEAKEKLRWWAGKAGRVTAQLEACQIENIKLKDKLSQRNKQVADLSHKLKENGCKHKKLCDKGVTIV